MGLLKGKYLLSATGILFPLLLCAQSEFVINTGTDVIINQGCQVIFADGGMVNADGQFVNAGELVVEGNVINAGVLAGGASSGICRVLNDIENNGTMQPGQGSFHLYGDDQTMRGSERHEYFNLRLEGTGVKLMQQDIRTAGELRLNDRELRAGGFTAIHTNPDPNSVQHDWEEGFVSALAGGGISRATNSTSPYFFPLGSTVGSFRYRPVELRPASGAATTYKVRFANEPSPDHQSLSAEIYYINYPFHHIVERTSGGTAADVRIMYMQSSDGAFETLAHRNTGSSQWELNANTVQGDLLGGYDSFVTEGWNGFEHPEMSLARRSTELFVPNVFSPNDDGENDLFIARGTGIRNFKMVVYDRWGNKVFESEDIMQGWDGTFRGVKMNSAVFVYYILSGDEVISKGNVTLLR